MIKKTTCIPLGMSLDLNISQANNSFLFDAMNVRVTAREHDTLLCITNEKSTKAVGTTSAPTTLILFADLTVVGYCVLNKYLVIFTTFKEDTGSHPYNSRIHIIESTSAGFTQHTIQGNFDFVSQEENQAIETVGLYESETIQKVYWTDGVNPPRVINIADYVGSASYTITDDKKTLFDFYQPTANDTLTCSIVKRESSNGVFPCGTVQYVFTYYNLNGVQTAPFYISDLLYTNPEGRGGSPEELADCSFDMSFTHLDLKFSYIRAYRILRSTKDGEPSVEFLPDVQISSGHTATVTDNGTGGTSITPTDVYYLGGDSFKCRTLTSKDGVLFCGNLILNNNYIDKTTANIIKTQAVKTKGFASRIIEGTLVTPSANWSKELYLETFELDDSVVDGRTGLASTDADITFFKYGEYYRFGVQFKDKFNQWSNVICIDPEVVNNVPVKNWGDGVTGELSPSSESPTAIDTPHSVSLYVVEIAKSILPESVRENYVAARLVCVYPEVQDRTVLCQGIVCPTVYNALTRFNGTCYAQSDWFSRPLYAYRGDLYSSWKDFILKWSITTMNNGRGSLLFNIHNTGLPFNRSVCSEIRGQYASYSSSTWNATESAVISSSTDSSDWAERRLNVFFVDYNVVTLHSPDIEFDDTLKEVNFDSSNIKFLPVGKVAVKGTYGKVSAIISNWHGDKGHINNDLIESLPIQVEDEWWCDSSGLINRPVLLDSTYDSSANTYYKAEPLYPWHTENLYSSGDTHSGHIDNKIFSNLKVCWNTMYAASTPTAFVSSSYPISNTKLVDSEVPQLYEITPKNSGITGAYYTNAVDQAVLPSTPYYTINNILVKSTLNSLLADDGFLLQVYGKEYITDQGVKNPASSISHPAFNAGIIIDSILNTWTPGGSALVISEVWPSYTEYNGEYTDSINFPSDPDEDVDIYLLKGGMLRLGAGGNRGNTDVRYVIALGGISEVNITARFAKDPNFLQGDLTITNAVDDSGNPVRLQVLLGPLRLSLDTTTSSEGVNIKYKSGPHIVFAFDYKNSSGWKQVVLPRYYDVAESFNSNATSGYKTFWGDRSNGAISLDAVIPNTPDGTNITDLSGISGNSYFILGELRRTSVPNRFGGNTESVYALNKWVPCSEEVTLSDTTGGALIIDGSSASIGGTGNHTLILEDGDGVSYAYEDLVGTEYQTVAITASSGVNIPNRLVLQGTKGDTYFQRYDHLKTYPYSQNDTNSIVDIVSFCCETHINLNGRYDKNKGLKDNTMITKEIFNQLNMAYTLQDNWFTLKYLTEDKTTAIQTFPNLITWSLPKSYGEIIDTWTNISLASTLDLDGDRGALKALRRWNDKLLFFQEKGLGLVNYNERTIMNTESGLPVLIANSNKVEGKTYLSTTVGCLIPQTIAETKQGLYFADNNSHSLYQIGSEGLNSISEQNGMSSYLRGVTVEKAFSDILHNELYFTTTSLKDTSVRKSLCYNEQLQKFTSFFDYEDASVMTNLDDKLLAVSDTDGRLWELFAGTDYNKIFGVYRDYYVTYRVAPREENELPSDNVFDYIEYQGDFYDGLTGMPILDTEDASDIRPDRKFLFDTMEVSNEYLNAEAELSSFNTKKKFRIWRTQFPRANKQGRSSASNAIHGERIRNPWIKLTLKKNNSAAGAANKDAEMRLYNLSVFSTKY